MSAAETITLPAFATDAQMAGFWTYQYSSPTPSLAEAIEAGAIAAGTTEKQWHQLTPGMKREIVRSARKRRATATLKAFDDIATDEKRAEHETLVDRKTAAHFAAKERF